MISSARVSILVELGKTALAAANFFLMATILGPTSYGGYVVIAAVAALLTQIFTAGFSQWVQPLAAKSGVGAAASAILPITIFVSLPSLCLVAAVAAFIDVSDNGMIFMIIATEAWVFPLWTSLNLSLLATQQLRLYLASSILIPGVKLGVSVIVLVVFDGGLLQWASGALLFGTVGIFLTVLFMSSFRLEMNFKYFRLWLRNGFGFAFVGGASAAAENVDRIIINSILGPTAVGIYGVGARLSSYGTVPVKGLALVNYPMYFKHVSEHDFDGLTRTVSRAVKQGVSLGILVAVGLVVASVVFADNVLADYHGFVPLMIVLAIAIPARAIQYACGDALYALGRTRERLIVTLLGALITGTGAALGANVGGLLGASLGVSVSAASVAALLAFQVRRSIVFGRNTNS